MPVKGVILTAEQKAALMVKRLENAAKIAGGELPPKKTVKIGDMTFIVADEKETEVIKTPKAIQLVRNGLNTPADKVVKIHLNEQTLNVFKDDKIRTITISISGYLFEFTK